VNETEAWQIVDSDQRQALALSAVAAAKAEARQLQRFATGVELADAQQARASLCCRRTA